MHALVEKGVSPPDVVRAAIDAAMKNPAAMNRAMEVAAKNPKLVQSAIQAASKNPAVVQSVVDAAMADPKTTQVIIDTAMKNPKVVQAVVAHATTPGPGGGLPPVVTSAVNTIASMTRGVLVPPAPPVHGTPVGASPEGSFRLANEDGLFDVIPWFSASPTRDS